MALLDINIIENADNKYKLGESMQKKIFLTFDIDWASDTLIKYTYDILKAENVKATFFVTHKSDFINSIKDDPNIELGIHPNFNRLFDAENSMGGVWRIMDEIMEIVPNAISTRSHALVQGSLIQSIGKAYIKFDCNTYMDIKSDVLIKPYLNPFGTTSIPHFFEDDVNILFPNKLRVDDYLDYKGLKVFDFHPVHIGLNNDSMDRYNSAKEYTTVNTDEIFKFRNNAYGAEDILREVIAGAKKRSYEFLKICEVYK